MQEPQVPSERWINSLLDAARVIADKNYQESCWLALDAQAWESPDEAINALDDCVLEGFLEQFSDSFSAEQAKAVSEFRDELARYCSATPQHLDPVTVLADPQWQVVRNKATAFVKAFRGKWPRSST